MKILRSYPLIATAILGLIFLGLYKTSNFVNRQVEVEKLLLIDSISTKPLSLMESVSDSLIESNTDTSKIVDVQGLKDTELIAQINPITPSTPSNLKEETEIVSEKTNVISKTKEAKRKKRVNLDPSSSIDNSQSVHNVKKSETIATKSISGARFHVIIGSYSVEANAKSDALKFEKKNETKVNILKHKGFFRVSVDNFDSEKEAALYASKLEGNGEKTLVLKF